MPRDGTGHYAVPSGTYGVPNTTIASTPYNTDVDDVAADLNAPRPIVAGGTNASTPYAALSNLSAEMAQQQVTNYDTNPVTGAWLSGSFWSNSAVSDPVYPVTGHKFVGQTIVYDVNNIILQAYDLADNKLYTRIKTAGLWGSWLTTYDPNNKVAKAGDTMTGQLNMSYLNPTLTFNTPNGGSN